MRHVCRFSCGAASAVATKIILSEQSPADVLILNAFLQEEHPDNRRFLADCEKWFGHTIHVVRDAKYNASTHEIWMRKRYIISHLNAACSAELKRKVLAKFANPDDVVVLGFTADEEDRFYSLQERFPEEKFRAPLIERGLGKDDCLAVIDRAGIVLPAMYRLGYQNANCIGCPKGGIAYWQHIRRDFPEQFVQIKTIQEEIGPGANFLRFRSGPRSGERMSLAELPAGEGDMTREPNFSCSFFCALVEQEWKKNEEAA